MKKYSLIAIIVLAALVVAACNRNRNKLSPEADENAWMYDETLPVPIQFGSSGSPFTVESKGLAITSLTDLEFNILAMDFSKAIGKASGYNVATLDEGANNGTSILLPGVDATIVHKTPSPLPEGDYVQFKKNGNAITRYYPMNAPATEADRSYYSFVAYKVPQGASLLVGDDASASADRMATAIDRESGAATNQAVYAYFKTLPSRTNAAVDRNVDVLWGRADADTDDSASGIQPFDGGVSYGNIYGFNARYMRVTQSQDPTNFNNGDYLPQIKLEHRLSAIQIIVKADVSEGGFFLLNNKKTDDPLDDEPVVVTNVADYTNGTYGNSRYVPMMNIKDVLFNPVISSAQLNLRTGEVTVDSRSGQAPHEPWGSGASASDFHPIYTGVNDFSVPVDPRVTDGYVYGTDNSLSFYIYVIPGARTNDQAPQITFTLDTNGVESDNPVITLTMPNYDATHKGFKPGYTYTYTLSVKGVPEMAAMVELSGWTTAGDDQYDDPTDPIIPIG